MEPLKDGTEIGQFQIIETIDNGGLGIVYRARNRWIDQYVAIKELAPRSFAKRVDGHIVADEKKYGDRALTLWKVARLNFRREAEAMLQLMKPAPHRNVVQILGWWEIDETPFMILSLEDGPTLKQMIRASKDRTLPYTSLLAMLPGIEAGLSWIHDKGYVHGDIKPGNILVRTEDREPVLLDLGSTRVHLTPETKRLLPRTLPYAAPEIEKRDHRVPDVKADIYGCAATLYHAVTGVAPCTAEERARQLIGMGEPTAERFVPAVIKAHGRYPSHFLKAVDEGMSLDERARPANAKVWFRRLFKIPMPATIV